MKPKILFNETQRFDDIEDLEKGLLEIYDSYATKISKGDYITSINKLIKSLKDLKNDKYIVLNKEKVALLAFKKLKDGKIGVYNSKLVFDDVSSGN